MSTWDELGLDAEIIEEFVGEAISGLDSLRSTLLHLEEEGSSGIDAILRWVHTVKGTSGFLNLSELQSFAHKFETYLQKLNAGKIEMGHSSITRASEGVELMNDALLNLRKQEIALSQEYEEFIRDLPLDTGPSEQEESIEKVMERLRTITSALEDKKEIFVNKGLPSVVLESLTNLEEYLKKLEDFKVQVVVKALTLERVTSEDGTDLTDWVKTLLEGIEDVMLVGSNAKSLNSDHVKLASNAIHQALYPAETKDVFQWSMVVDLVELMPEIVEDFWKKFWFDSLEKRADISYFGAADLTKKYESEIEAVEKEEQTEQSIESGEQSQQTQPENAEDTIRVASDYLELFTRRTEALVMNRNYMENLGLEMKNHLPSNVSMEFREGIDDLEQNIEELQKYLFRVRSTRLGELFERMPRMVRKLEKDLGKSVRVNTRGEDIEVDRTVVNILSDIFVHVVRNSIDHGIESPEERKAAGKSETGTIMIHATIDDDWIMIEIRDDGRGINEERVLKKAIEKGLADPDKTYSNAEIYNFLLQPGFSTAQAITNVSGRGVGMDVVASAMRKQGGKVEIESEWTRGTTIHLSFPTRKGSLTRDVLLIELDQRIYAVNHDCLKEIIDANTVEANVNRGDAFFCHRGNLINLVDLSMVLHKHSASSNQDDKGRLLILEDELGNTVAARVDRVLNKMQVVIKGFNHDFLKENDLFEGTVVVGLGQPILVLNLKNSAVLSAA